VTRDRDRGGPDAEHEPEAPLDPRTAELFALARSTLGEMTPARAQRGWARLRSRGAARRRRGRWLVTASLGAAAAAAIVLGLRFLHPQPAALTFEVQGGAVEANGAIHPTGHGASALKFVDGTVIELAPGSSGRLGEVDDRGAHVAIDDGSALVNVIPKPQARWIVDAGPFRIAVHGTVFTAAWDRARGRLDVRLEHGLVSVTGPVTAAPIPMHTGQHLTVSLSQKKVLLRALDAADDRLDDGALPAAPPIAAGPPAPAAGPPPARPAHVARPAGRSWTAELAAGHFDTILEDAGRDLTRALASRPTDELAALADAARYRRRDDVAERALHAQRRRFPGTVRATDAAFFLGRLSENRGAAGQAVRWYDQYLAEAPDGPYAADALGRKMIAVRDLRGDDAARDLAHEYLRRFPRGSYAGAASALRGGR
jgi:ferric-dicitrate binding protein FerR (iron transport regulator)